MIDDWLTKKLPNDCDMLLKSVDYPRGEVLFPWMPSVQDASAQYGIVFAAFDNLFFAFKLGESIIVYSVRSVLSVV
jgi:hypothetical protein